MSGNVDEIQNLNGHSAVTPLQGYATHIFLAQIENSQNTSRNSVREKICRNELEALPTIRELYQDIVNDAEKKMRMIEDMQKKYAEDYSAKYDALNQMMKVIDETRVQIKASTDGGINQQKLFDQESQLQDNKLGKIDEEIRFLSNTRDSLCAKIADKEKLSEDLNATIQVIRKANESLTEEISVIKRKSEDEAVAMSKSLETASKLLNEKMEMVNKAKQEKIRLMEEQNEILSFKAGKQIENENLRAKIDKLTAEVKAQENRMPRVGNAKKNICDDYKTTILALKQQRSLNGAELKQIENHMALMQIMVELKQKRKNQEDAQQTLKVFEKRNVILEWRNSGIKAWIDAAQSSQNDDSSPLPKRRRYQRAYLTTIPQWMHDAIRKMNYPPDSD